MKNKSTKVRVTSRKSKRTSLKTEIERMKDILRKGNFGQTLLFLSDSESSGYHC